MGIFYRGFTESLGPQGYGLELNVCYCIISKPTHVEDSARVH